MSNEQTTSNENTMATDDGPATDTVEQGPEQPQASEQPTDPDREGEDQVQDQPSDPDAVSQGDVAADYLEGFLDIADLDGDIIIDVENGRPSLSVEEVNEGELGRLVGRDGEVLTALQDLTRLAVARESGERSGVMVDVAGFREEQREQLRQIGRDAAAEVRESSQSVRLSAMNAFERKMVHDAVAEAGLSSASEGTDPNRYVVVSPA